jgi:hydroxymethylbilane synthase
LEAGCRAPVAGLARAGDGVLSLDGAVFSPDGSQTLRAEASGPEGDPAALGREVANRLLERGAAELIERARA